MLWIKTKPKSRNPLGQQGGARTQPKKINWKKIVKITGFSVAGLAVLEAIHSAIGGFTNSPLGIGSIGRVIRNRVNKDEKPNQDDNAKDESKSEVIVDNIDAKDKEIKKINDINNERNKKSKEKIIKNDGKSIKQLNFIKKNGQDLEHMKNMLNGIMSEINNNLQEELIINNNDKNNQELKDFDSAVIEQLDTQYHSKFNQALIKIKEHQFKDNEKSELEDLLNVVRDNKISARDALMLDVQKNVICVQLNKTIYMLELLGKDVKIIKDQKEVAYLK